MKAVAAALVLVLGCKDRAPEYGGIGEWRFSQTTLADAKHGKCEPTDLKDGRRGTWCFANPPYKLANRTAEVDLYFAGTEPEAKLIEIQLKVRGCVEHDLERWISENFGPPIERRPGRAYWKNAFVWIAGMIPDSPGRCLIHMLPLSESAEIGRIKQI